MRKSHSSKNGQVYYIEFMITLVVMIIALVIFIRTFVNVNESAGYDDLSIQADSISTQLMSEGLPANWTKSNVEKIGITNSQSRIQESKLLNFANMSYQTTRQKLNTNYNYYVFLENSTGSRILIAGKQGVGLMGNQSKTVVKVTRFPIYKSDIVRMIVYVWE